MAAYLIVNVEVTDAELYEEYRQQAPAVIALYGGRYLARGGAVKVLEGTWMPKRCVILQFPDMESLLRWHDSPEYRPLRALRDRAARSSFVATEGL